MKKLNIAKTLGIVGICGFIFGVISFLVTEAEEWAGIVLGLSIPFVFLYPLAKTQIDNEKEKEKVQVEENVKSEKEVAKTLATKLAINKVKEHPETLKEYDPFGCCISSDPTLDNK